jgi:membrane protein
MWQTFRLVAQRWSRDDASLLAAGVAYYAALSLFPVMMLLTSGLGMFLKWTHMGNDAQHYIFEAVKGQISPSLAANLKDALNQLQDNAGFGGPLGLAIFLVAALAIFAQFERAFDRIWEVPQRAGTSVWNSLIDLLCHRLRAFGMLMAMGMAIMAVFFAEMAYHAFQSRLDDHVTVSDWLWWASKTVLATALNAAVFSLLYRLLPKVPVSWQEALRGGLVASIIWELGRQLLASFVIGQRYTSAYGVIGSLMAIMLWVYYAVAVVFVGAEYIQAKRQAAKDSSDRSNTRETSKADPQATGRQLANALDVVLVAGVFYLALFLGMRYVSTQPRSSQDPSGDRVLLFSRDADTQHLVRSLFAPLIAVIPGKYVYPDRDPVEPAVELTEDLEKRAELTIAGAAGKGKQNHLR